MASEFTNKLSNYLWINKLKSGCIDKLKNLPIGSVKENYYICVIKELNKHDNTNIVKETKFLRQTKKQHKIIKEIEKNCAEKFGKKSVTLFSSEERDKLNKIIRNKLKLNGNIL